MLFFLRDVSKWECVPLPQTDNQQEKRKLTKANNKITLYRVKACWKWSVLVPSWKCFILYESFEVWKRALLKTSFLFPWQLKCVWAKKRAVQDFLCQYMSACQVWPICWNKMVLMYPVEEKTKAKRATQILEGRKCAKIQGNGLPFESF